MAVAAPFVATSWRGPGAPAAELPASSARVGQAARRCGALGHGSAMSCSCVLGAGPLIAHIGSTIQGLRPASQACFASGQPASKSKAAARRPN